MQRNIINTTHNTVSQGHVLLNASDSKRQKIVAAAHLVTEHLDVREALRNEVRMCALRLLAPLSHSDDHEARERLCGLLIAGSLAGLISQKNASIIEHEVKKVRVVSLENNQSDLTEFFGQEVSDTIGQSKRTLSRETFSHGHVSDSSSFKKTNEVETHYGSDTDKGQGNERKDITEIKKERKQKILEYINTKRTAVIKDIIALFPEVSEKTVQRELNVLLEENKIEKRGDKRWSLYVAKSGNTPL